MGKSDSHEAYWEDYDGLQAVKHAILGRYLDAWFGILSSFRGKLLFLDCHAGRGRHGTGDLGSPLVVLEGLLRHSSRDMILSRVEIICRFFENDQQNAEHLRREVREFGPIPDGVSVEVHHQDYERALEAALGELEAKGETLPPSFAFVDPFGFSLSMDLLNRMLTAGRTELLVNLMYRHVNMAVEHDSQGPTLDRLFGTRDWRQIRNLRDSDRRFSATIQLFAEQLAAEFVTWVVMRGASNEIKYALVHATNSLKGRRKMKETIWATVPDGSFTAYQRHRPEQGVLISVSHPPLREVADALARQFAGETVSLHADLYPFIDRSLFRRRHLHEVLRRAVALAAVRNMDEPGRFVATRNPRLVIPHEFPDLSEVPGPSDQGDLF